MSWQRRLAVTLVLWGAAAAAISLSGSRAPHGVLRTDGRDRALPGGAAPVSRPTAGIAHGRKLPKPGVVSKPTVLHLRKAHGAVFDARKLKGTVVKRERPEEGQPDGERENEPGAPNPTSPGT